MTAIDPAPAPSAPTDDDPRPRVWVDQDACTGDGICVQLAPEIFRMNWDGLAYVVADGALLEAPGASVAVDAAVADEVVDAAAQCPGDCIYVIAGRDGTVHGQPSPRPAPAA